jgi:alpha-beta hydrolase superfamily lysophospholipase
MQHHRTSFRASGGLELFSQRWQPDGRPAATLVLVHGVAEHSGRYEHVGRYFAGRGYDVWSYDQRGHGRSPGRRAYVERFSTFLADLETFRLQVAARQPGPQFLLGHSMGGTIALAHAIERPAAWTGLVLSGPSVDPTAGVSRALVVAGRLAARVAPAAPVVSLDDSGVSRDPEVLAAYRADPLVHHGKLTARLASELVDRAALFEDQVGGLALPVLVLLGGDDKLVPPDGMRRLFTRIGSADKRLLEYPGAAHELFNEPEKATVLTDVADWLDAHWA